MSNTQSDKQAQQQANTMGTGPGKSGKENADMDRDTTADAEVDGDLAKGEVNPGEETPAEGLSGKDAEKSGDK